MASISAAIEISDGLSSAFQIMTQSINNTVGAAHNMDSVLDRGFSTDSVQRVQENIDNVTDSVGRMKDGMQDIPPMEIPPVEVPEIPPVQVPVEPVWQEVNQIEMFGGDAVSRYTQEIQSAANMTQKLAAVQASIAARSQNTRLFPANMQSDLMDMSNRISGIRDRIQQIQDNPINMGSQQANNELEDLRGQLNDAIGLQENLNDAVRDMDVSKANDAYEQLNGVVRDTERYLRDNVSEQGTFNDKIQEGIGHADSLANSIRGAVGAFVGLAGIRKGVNWLQESLGLTNIQTNAEVQLDVALQNAGAAEGSLDRIRKKASDLQGLTVFGDESFLGGAAEFSTYMSDINAIESMMNTLSNYAAGMSGGGEVGFQQMVEYATQLGKAYDGTFDGLKKKGFELTEAQQEIIEKGTEMERALVIDDVISQSWQNLAVQMAQTPEGKIIALKNAWGDIREEVGARVYPAVMHLFDTIGAYMPQIEEMVMGFVPVIQGIIFAIEGIIQVATGVYDFFVNNWSMIAPIIMAIVTALGIYKGIMLTLTVIEGISNGIKAIMALSASAHAAATMMESGATFTATVAQHGLNAALLACPLTWIIIAIIAIIAAIYLIVAAINKVTGSSISATGVICGAFAAAGAFILNLVLGVCELVLGIINFMINPFITFANFIGNFLQDPVSAIVYLFQGMADNVLGLLEKIASALDFIFGSNMADTVAGWRSGLKGMADDLVRARGYDPNDYNNIDNLDLSMDKFGAKRIAYGDAYDAGYDFGQGIDDTIANFSMDDLFGGADSIPSAGDYAYDGGSGVGAGSGGMGSVPGNVGSIADSTGAMAKSVDITEEQLKYLRDIAEREVINRFTTAEVNVDFGGVTNNVKSDMDLDGVVSYIEDKVSDALKYTAEKVHA